MQEYDYTQELINKWTACGHLAGVAEQDRVKVAQRLEAAFRRSLGQHGEFDALGKELQSLRREGYFGPQQRTNEQRMPQVRQRKVRSRMHRVRDTVRYG